MMKNGERIIRVPNSGKVTMGKEYAGAVFLVRELSSGEMVFLRGRMVADPESGEESFGFHMHGMSDFAKTRASLAQTLKKTKESRQGASAEDKKQKKSKKTREQTENPSS